MMNGCVNVKKNYQIPEIIWNQNVEGLHICTLKQHKNSGIWFIFSISIRL